MGISKRHLEQAGRGDHRVKTMLRVRGVMRVSLLHISATCALCFSTPKATRRYPLLSVGLLRLVVVPQWSTYRVWRCIYFVTHGQLRGDRPFNGRAKLEQTGLICLFIEAQDLIH